MVGLWASRRRTYVIRSMLEILELRTPTHDCSQEIYSDLPPLTNLVQLLSPVPGSGGSFDIQINVDTFDYEDLCYHIDILSIALSGIDGYVAQERLLEAGATREDNIHDSPRKFGKEKPQTQLDMIRAAIDMMHGKIGKLMIWCT